MFPATLTVFGALYVLDHICTSINSCYHFYAYLVNIEAARKKNYTTPFPPIYSFSCTFFMGFETLANNLLIKKWPEYWQTYRTDSNNSVPNLLIKREILDEHFKLLSQVCCITENVKGICVVIPKISKVVISSAVVLFSFWFIVWGGVVRCFVCLFVCLFLIAVVFVCLPL